MIKKLAIIGWFIALLFGLVVYFLIRDNYSSDYQRMKVYPGEVVIQQSFLDSLRYIAELPPDTIRETRWIKGDPYEVEVPISELEVNYTDMALSGQSDTSTVNSIKDYRYAMINVGIDAWIKLKVKGNLENFKWGYSPTYRFDETIIEKPVPFPVVQRLPPIKVPQRGLYVMGGIGGNFPRAAGSVELLYQQQNGVMYGPQVIFLGEERYYLAKFAIKIL